MREPSTDAIRLAGEKFQSPHLVELDPIIRGTLDQALNDISFHHADDSGKEWGQAKVILDELADYVIAHKINYSVIRFIFLQGKYLCEQDQLMTRVMTKLYERLP